MRKMKENYTTFLIAGLSLTLVLVGAIAVYTWRSLPGLPRLPQH